MKTTERLCDYFCHKKLPSGKLIVKMSGEGRTMVIETTLNGVEFRREGPDACLWLVRDLRAIPLAIRENGEILLPLLRSEGVLELTYTAGGGISILPDAGGLLAGDSFVILSKGVTCAPGSHLGMVLTDEPEDVPQPVLATA